MDREEFAQFISLIDSVTGIRSPETNHGQVRRAIRSHCSRRRLTEKMLLFQLKFDEKLREEFLNDVMIGETYFFREAGHFSALERAVLPELLADGRSIRIWSAACSTGEEAVSLAVLAEEHRRKRGRGDYRVFATDLNSRSLERLQNGVYPRSALRRDGERYHDLLLSRYIEGGGETDFSVSSRILSKIESRKLNLYADPVERFPERLDIIFFRNTLIYFDEDKRQELVNKMVLRLNEGGFLFLGTGELPFVRHPLLKGCEKENSYLLQKTGGEPAFKAAVPAAPVAPAAPAVPVPAAGSFSAEAVIELLRQSGTDESEEEDLHRRMARRIIGCISAINRDDRGEAELLLQEIHRDFPETAVSHYCEGWYHHTGRDRKAALSSFSSALRLDETFWPARFYRAQGLVESDPSGAREDFSLCMESIEKAKRNRKNGFAFLLAEFNDSYFMHMCRRWMEKLEAREAVSGGYDGYQ